MNKKRPINLYEMKNVGLLDLSVINAVHDIEKSADGSWRFSIYCNSTIYKDSGGKPMPILTMVNHESEEELKETRDALCEAMIAFHYAKGISQGIFPEAVPAPVEPRTIDPISSLDLTPSTETP